MSAWIRTRNVASKPRAGGPAPFQIALISIVFVGCASSAASAQGTSIPEIQNGEVRTLPPVDTDRIRLSTARNGPPAAPKNFAKDDSCLLPPLNLTTAAAVSAEQLQIPANAKKEYQRACAALKDKKTAEAEKHLRKAVQDYPKYSAGWVTLGQMLEAQQRTDEARSACLQGSTLDSIYVPAYLCLADIAMRGHDWEEVLKSSGRAIELDPSNNAVAYEYHAAANLRIHKLEDAEKSALRAVEIDKNHREPRVHFVLAQVYEAKGDPENEAAHLKEYLKYTNDPDDQAMVKQYLSELEKQTEK
jgi:tetratricopeptide (TPR) repeat protein